METVTPTVYFYYAAPHRIEAVRSLLYRAWMRKQSWVVVYAPETEMADEINRALWLAPPTSFVPHCLDSTPIAAYTPILISRTLGNKSWAQSHPNLLNLAIGMPPGYTQYSTIIEVIDTKTEVRQAARQRIVAYQKAEYKIDYRALGRG